MDALQSKLKQAETIIAHLGRAVVALSGGVDSSLLLCLAARALGPEHVLAVTAVGPIEAEEDLEVAVAVADLLGVKHRVLEVDSLEIEGFAANPADRCYLCRRQLYAVLAEVAGEWGLGESGSVVILDGANADDGFDYRPGLRAAKEAGVRHPLAEAGLTKAEVRTAAEQSGLPVWDKPASPCLASRFPYGETITREALAKVERAESLLHEWGFPVVRVRHHSRLARIEVPSDRVQELSAEPLRSQVIAALHDLGYAYVCVDLQGFRSGSLNEVLPLAASEDQQQA